MLALFLFGFAFGFANSVQSRVLNNGTRRRFPDALLAVSVLAVSAVYATAMRAVAVTVGFEPIAVYAGGQTLGVVLGAKFANGPLFDRFHAAATHHEESEMQ